MGILFAGQGVSDEVQRDGIDIAFLRHGSDIFERWRCVKKAWYDSTSAREVWTNETASRDTGGFVVVVDGAFGVHALGRCHRRLPHGDEMQRQYGATL